MLVWMKRAAWLVLALGVILVALAFTGSALGDRKRNRTIAVQVQPVAWATDTAGLERGRYLYASRGCADCHGSNGAGREFINDGKGMIIAGPNITVGGPVAAYQPEDWVRILRHGVKRDGKAAFIMPSEDYARFTDADVAALGGYVRTLAPQTGGAAVVQLPLPVKVLYGFNAIEDAAQKIDHTLAPAQPIPVAINPAHGAYVANMCIGCHGPGLSGGKIPGGPPDWPAAANLTPGAGNAMASYKDEGAFLAMLKSGKRPDGSTIQVMPFESLRELNEIDAKALYAYLLTVAPRATGLR